MVEVRVGQRGEIVIPKRLRERYGIRPNSTIELKEGVNLELKPKTMDEALTETYVRWKKLQRPVDRALLEKVLKMEPYEDEDEHNPVR